MKTSEVTGLSKTGVGGWGLKAELRVVQGRKAKESMEMPREGKAILPQSWPRLSPPLLCLRHSDEQGTRDK